MRKIAEFPFKHIALGSFGHIFRPYALCEIELVDQSQWISAEMIVDTGADYTLLPVAYADILGVNLAKDCIEENTFGIGGREKVYLYKGLHIKIAHLQKRVTVGFLSSNSAPPLLGRLGFLETMKVVFYNSVTAFEE